MQRHVKTMAKIAILSLSFAQITYSKGLADLGNAIPAELKALISYCATPNHPAKATCPKGTIVVGPTGIGKTRFAKACSEELGEKFIYVTGTTLAQAQAKDIKQLFADARSQNAVIYIDEFDAFAIDNFNGDANKSEIREAVVALMNEMDGFDTENKVVVIAASQTDSFHKSLLRAGRFSQIVKLPYPDEQTRINLLKELNQNQTPFDRSIDLAGISKLAYNFTPADLKSIVHKANVMAQAAKSSTITQTHLSQAFLNVLNEKCQTDKGLLIRLKVAINLLKNNKQETKGFQRIIGTIPNDVKELVDDLKNSGRFKQFNIKTPKGFLFTGPPGTGKTTLARAIAEETSCEFMSVSASEFIQGLVGAGGDAIRNLFAEARQKAKNSASGKTIIFIDELDALGKRTGGLTDATINELLTQMDGFDEDESVIVLAASNHPNNLDPAMLRPGRFSKIIKVGLPDATTREQLLIHYLKGKPYNKQIDIKKLVAATNNYSPADIKELTEKAAMLALKENKNQIELDHMIEGIRQGLQEKIIKGEPSAQQQIDALDVIFKGKASAKGFNQIIGGVPAEIKDLADMLNGKLDYKKFGVPYPKGILFTGPPGTGKTLLAKAIAEELGCQFMETKGSAFVEQFVGVGAQRVRELFAEAREKANGGKTIIFIDELDAIGSRSGARFQSEETNRTITELLTQLDGFSKDDSVIVIAATNNPASIDPALLRAGRFDTIVEIGLPDFAKRKALLEAYAKNRPVNGVSFDTLAQQLAGCNAADMKELVNKAATIAMRKGATSITQAHFNEALQIIQDNQDIRAKRFV